MLTVPLPVPLGLHAALLFKHLPAPAVSGKAAVASAAIASLECLFASLAASSNDRGRGNWPVPAVFRTDSPGALVPAGLPGPTITGAIIKVLVAAAAAIASVLWLPRASSVWLLLLRLPSDTWRGDGGRGWGAGRGAGRRSRVTPEVVCCHGRRGGVTHVGRGAAEAASSHAHC